MLFCRLGCNVILASSSVWIAMYRGGTKCQADLGGTGRAGGDAGKLRRAGVVVAGLGLEVQRHRLGNYQRFKYGRINSAGSHGIPQGLDKL